MKNMFITILAAIAISCNGQVQKEQQTLQAEKGSEMVKIPVPKNGFSDAYLDKDGSIWFCSNGGGIYHYNGKAFKNYTEENGLSSNQVYSITSDHNNNMWFGTQNGLTKYDRKQFENIPLPYQDTTTGWISTVYPTLSPNAAHSLATDNNNNLWIGTAGNGAYKYDGENFKSYLTEIGKKQEDSLYHNWIPCISKDNKGNMWFASMIHGGINKFDGEKFTQFSIKDGLSDSQVRTIYSDQSGNIWMGFNGNRNSGLTVYDGKSFITFSETDGLCSKRIRAIYEDRNGNLWLGAQFGNLCVLEGKKFSEFKYNGQTFSDLLFILGDLEYNIWFGGVNGIWKYDGEIITAMTTNK
ncbi:MAG: two-component regulator propeller domain-containing protein [Imperialibacter sp.]|uniref:ligand-binding sensor domain-containing protein n=1 Tax=Imperialibacter sp. TaxID=2038411 RepID=UPI0032EEE876